MADNNKPHEPVLMPKEGDKAKRKKPSKQSGEPVLLPENQREFEQNTKPPYLLLFFVAFGLLSVFWKMFFYGDEIKKQEDNRAAYNNEKLIEK